MKTNLLNDVICESDFVDFRADLARQFRAETRRRKWKRQSAWLAVAAAVALVALLNFHKQPQTQVVTRPVVVAPRDLVPTITTSMMKFDDLLITAKEPVPVIHTRPLIVGIITTDQSKALPSISDVELVNLFPKHPTGLIAAHGEKRFIFVDPADAKRFMSSN